MIFAVRLTRYHRGSCDAKKRHFRTNIWKILPWKADYVVTSEGLSRIYVAVAMREMELQENKCLISWGPVAQWIWHLTTNQGIAGSSPARINTFNEVSFIPFDVKFYSPTYESEAIVGRYPNSQINCLSDSVIVPKHTDDRKSIDRDRTRTCNPQIRSLVPYPLGHTVSCLGWISPIASNFASYQYMLQ